MVVEPAINQCVTCGNTVLSIQGSMGRDHAHTSTSLKEHALGVEEGLAFVIQVHCPICGMTGAKGRSRSEAIQYWNLLKV